MYDFIGCPCAACKTNLQPGDDVVVCPDCGAPYHRHCYEAAGQCSFAAQHADNFEWTPPNRPKQEEKTATCPRCNTENALSNRFCKQCGLPLEREASSEQSSGFDYQRFYTNPDAQAAFQATFGAIDPNEQLDDISAADWASYIGPASGRYLHKFKKMELLKRKSSVSLAAMLFGPFYFFYRKCWKPAFLFLAIELALETPSLLILLVLSESRFAPPLSVAQLTTLGNVAAIINFVVLIVRGMYGVYFYKKEAAKKIRRIQEQFPDPEKRSFVLSAQGGTSLAAILGAFVLLFVLSGLFCILLGPNIPAMLAALS